MQVEIQEQRSGPGPLALRGQGQRAPGTRRRGPPTGVAELPRNTGMVAKRDEKFTEEVEAAEQHTGPVALPAEEATARRGRASYALLVGLLSGRGLKVLQGVTKHKGIRSHRCAEEERPGRTPDGDSDLSKEVTPKPRSCGKMGADLHRTSARLAQSGRGKGRRQGQM